MRAFRSDEDYPGDAENHYQTSVNSHTLKIQSITPSNKKTVIASAAFSPEPSRRGSVAISSLQQPKPHFVRSYKPLPINSADLHTRGPPPDNKAF